MIIIVESDKDGSILAGIEFSAKSSNGTKQINKITLG